jgi:glutamate synthase (NADPH/NADH) small chain
VGKNALPVAIGKLETFVTEWQHTNGVLDNTVLPPTGRRVAVVGSGPAGIGCAERLARAGHHVVIYEAWPEPGGILLYGIPDFKLNKPAVERKFEELARLGIELVTSTRIGADIPLEDLRRDFDAVFLGYGATVGSLLGLEHEDAPGVFSATEFLVRANLESDLLPESMREPLPQVSNVVVIGGGDTRWTACARRLASARAR